MAISQVSWIVSNDDPDAWYYEITFETDQQVTVTCSFFRSCLKTYVEVWPKNLPLFEGADWWHEDKKVWQ